MASEIEIQDKLNKLAEFTAEKEFLKINEKKLIDEIVVSDNVIQINRSGNQKLQELDQTFNQSVDALKQDAAAKLELIVIPDEIKHALELIDLQRKKIRDVLDQDIRKIGDQIRELKSQAIKEMEIGTKDAYAEVERKKADIKTEFAASIQSAASNIETLTAEIKKDVAEFGETVSSDRILAVYVKPKKTWIPKRLDEYVEKHPEIKDCYDLGDPSVSIKWR